ncbi:MAG: efflux RND transporter periplasmic adaptor subunit [Gemmatimonadales bacterium]
MNSSSALRRRLYTVASLAVLGGACSKPAARAPRPAIAVTVIPVKRASVPYDIDANGIVAPLQTANVSPQVDGIITDVDFAEGSEVTKGQVLFHLDPRPYQAAYNQVVAALARDMATAEFALKQADRYGSLVKQGIVTAEQAEQLRSASESAKATVLADSANLATAKFNLDNTAVRAPISGRTGSLLVRTGNLVHSSGGTALVVINQVRPILVRFAVPAGQLPMVLKYGERDGKVVSLPVTAVPGSLLDNAAPVDTANPMDPAGGNGAPAQKVRVASGVIDPDAKGGLSFIDNAVDTTTGTVTLKGTFPNPRGTLWAGQFVATSLRLYVEDSVLVLPTQAVVTGQTGTYVYVIDSNDVAQQRPVTVERAAGMISVIASGVMQGERVVTDGQSRVTPGAHVTLGLHDSSAGDGAGMAGAAAGGRGRSGGGRGGRGGRGKKADTTASKPGA